MGKGKGGVDSYAYISKSHRVLLEMIGKNFFFIKFIIFLKKLL